MTPTVFTPTTFILQGIFQVLLDLCFKFQIKLTGKYENAGIDNILLHIHFFFCKMELPFNLLVYFSLYRCKILPEPQTVAGSSLAVLVKNLSNQTQKQAILNATVVTRKKIMNLISSGIIVSYTIPPTHLFCLMHYIYFP